MRHAGAVLHFACATPPPHSWKRRAAPRSQPAAARGESSGGGGGGAGLPQQPPTQPRSTAEPTAAPLAAQHSARRGKKEEGNNPTAPAAAMRRTPRLASPHAARLRRLGPLGACVVRRGCFHSSRNQQAGRRARPSALCGRVPVRSPAGASACPP